MDQDTDTETKRQWTQAELLAEATARFGEDPKKFAFICPSCKDVASIQDFIDAGADPGLAGQECIGRSLGALARGKKPGKDGIVRGSRGCDWCAYGLFRGPWLITMPAEGDKPERQVGSFALAEATS